MAKVWKVRKDGTAPEEAQNGDFVVTNGGTYKVGDKDFHHAQINTYNYKGEYANPDMQLLANAAQITKLPGNPNNPGKPTTLPGNPNLPANVTPYGNQPPAPDTPNAVKQYTTPGTDANAALAEYFNASRRRSGGGAYPGSDWDDRTRQLINQALGLDYTGWTQGDQYKALADRYAQQGQRAMDETVAQIAARTGGLASSYAGVAGQQQYNAYMEKLEDAARQQFAQQRADAIQNAGLSQQMGAEAYQRWQDEQKRRATEDSTQMQLIQQMLENAAGDRDFGVKMDEIAYNHRQDAIKNEQWNKQWEKTLADDEWNKKAKKAEILAGTGNYSGYAELFGLSDEETQALVDAYATQQGIAADKAARELAEMYAKYGDFSGLEALGIDTTAARERWALDNAVKQKNATRSSRSGGGGGGGSNPTAFDWSDIDKMAETKSDKYIENYLEVNYKKLGFKTASAAKAAWENHLEDIEGESGESDSGDATPSMDDVFAYAAAMRAKGYSEADVNDFINEAGGLPYMFDAYHYYDSSEPKRKKAGGR